MISPLPALYHAFRLVRARKYDNEIPANIARTASKKSCGACLTRKKGE